MLHNLTIGHLDTDVSSASGVSACYGRWRWSLNRLLAELGGKDGEGRRCWTRERSKSRMGILFAHGGSAAYRNRVAEQFATRLQEGDRVVLADREHSRLSMRLSLPSPRQRRLI